MSTATINSTTEVSQPQTKTAGRLMLTGQESSFNDWRDDLVRDGYAVVKGAIPRDRAAGYVDELHAWLESFNLGYKRDDPSTVHHSKLPVINEKGMCLSYGIAHEDVVWRIRAEPGVVGAFETVYDDKDIIVSFDAVNFGFPNRTDLPPNKPWAHQDQDPTKPGFRCLQGLVNLLPNGPDDGGLIVCKGAHLLSEKFHVEFANEPDRIPQWTNEWYGFTKSGLDWLAERGCEWVKVCAEPGDLLLWDSRTPHYNLSPKGDTPRFCVYTCYMPVADATQEDLIRKKDAFERRVGTTHWPNAQHTGSNVQKIKSLNERIEARGGIEDPHNRMRPATEPQLSERAYKLTGIPYIKEVAEDKLSSQLDSGL